VFAQVARPAATEDTPGAFLGPWRKMSMDGLEWDIPDTGPNAAAFGYPGTGDAPAAYPKARAVTIAECASHAPVLAAIGPCVSKGSGEQSLARDLYPRLEPGWLLIADRNFYNWQDWCAAAGTGAALLWRVKSDLILDPLAFFPDGSYRSVLVNPQIRGKARDKIREAARAGQDLDPQQARYVRVVEYEVPDRDGDGKGELIALITTIADFPDAPAPVLAQAYHGRWESETGNARLKTYLRGPGKILRPESPDLVRQEIWGYLLTRYAISALICTAATNAGIDPDRVKFKRTVRIIRRRAAGPASPLTSASASWTVSWPPSPARSTSTSAASAATPRGQARSPQPLPGQETRPARHPPRCPRHHQTRQSHPDQRKSQNRSMIKISKAALHYEHRQAIHMRHANNEPIYRRSSHEHFEYKQPSAIYKRCDI
jgi:hypothetical protein